MCLSRPSGHEDRSDPRRLARVARAEAMRPGAQLAAIAAGYVLDAVPLLMVVGHVVYASRP
jgi:hypothetical protein